MKTNISEARLNSTLNRTAVIPAALVVVALLGAIAWNFLDQQGKAFLAYRNFLSEIIFAQEKVFAQEIYLNQDEAVHFRLEAIVSDKSLINSNFRACVRVTPINALSSASPIVACTEPRDGIAWDMDADVQERIISVGAAPIAKLQFIAINPFQWTQLFPVKLAPLLLIALLFAWVLHRYSVMNLRRNVLRPLLAQIAKTERNDALAQATQMIAHDLKKPFAILKLAMSSLAQASTQEEFAARRREVLPEVERGLEMVGSMLADITDIGASSSFEREHVSIVREIKATLSELRKLYPKLSTTIHLDLTHTVKPLANSKRINRVISNLLENAFQAVNSGGIIEIRSRDAFHRSEPAIDLSIRNTGSNISEESFDRIFDPFFTTKKNGTGLGLAIAKKFVEEHGGAITCLSTAANGTEFRLLLPAGSEPEDDLSSSVTTSRVAAASADAEFCEIDETHRGRPILIFDDEKLVHDTWRRSAGREDIPTVHFDSWEDFVDRSAFALAKDAIAFIDINYRGSRFDGMDIARSLQKLGAGVLFAITAEPGKARESGLFRDVLGKECPENLSEVLIAARRRS